MKRITHIGASLVLIGSFAACKNNEDRAESVDNAREKVVDKQEKVEERQAEVAEAKAELKQARFDFVTAVDKRLAEMDLRIAEARNNPRVDHAKLERLRADAQNLRANAVDESKEFQADSKSRFERVIGDIEAALDPDDNDDVNDNR